MKKSFKSYIKLVSTVYKADLMLKKIIHRHISLCFTNIDFMNFMQLY